MGYGADESWQCARDPRGDEPGTARLEEAVAAYLAAFEEWTQERVPLGWAMIQLNLSEALIVLADRTNDGGMVGNAIQHCEAGLKVFHEVNHTPYAVVAADILGKAKILQEHLKENQ